MPHTPAAAIFALVFVTFTLVGLIGTWEFAGTDSLAPLLAAAPLAVLQLGYDQSGKSRRLIPELAGAVAISSSAAIIAHAAGWSAASSLALWCVFASRSIASLVYVRSRLLLTKGKASSTLVPVALHVAALAAVVMLAMAGLSPKLAVPAFVMLLVRASVGLSPWRLKLRAMQIGVLEVTFGTLTVAAVVLGHYLHI